jgi:hypothetical protein
MTARVQQLQEKNGNLKKKEKKEDPRRIPKKLFSFLLEFVPLKGKNQKGTK